MIALALPVDDLKPKRRWLRSEWWKAIAGAIVILAAAAALELWASGLPLSWTAEYDRAKYRQITRAIAADTGRLRHQPFDKVRTAFGLDEAPWDDGIAFQLPEGMYRIYHFPGFAVHITLQRLPIGSSPDHFIRTNWTHDQLEAYGVLWLFDSPQIRIDGLNSREERMKRHYEELDQECARINAEMERRRRAQSN